MKKVLTGEGYTASRFAGILHECFVERNGGALVPSGNTTYYGEGSIVTNSITGEIGLVVDTESAWFGLGEPHLTRLVDVVDGDGWCDTTPSEG